jgi:hypothetical protein
MDTEDLSLDDSSKRKVIESISEIVPNIVIAIFFSNLIVEAIDCRDVP